MSMQKSGYLLNRRTNLFLLKQKWLHFIFFLLISGVAFSQNIRDKRVTISYSYEQLSNCLKQLQDKAGITISFNENEVSKYTVNDLSLRDATVEEALNKLLQNTNLQFREINNGIVVFTKTTSVIKNTAERKIVGMVTTQEDGKPLQGVSVQIKGSFRGTMTNANGKFDIKVPNDKNTLQFSSSGFESKEALITGSEMNISLKIDTRQMENVVVIGYGQVNKKDVTGSVSSLKGEELNKMAVSNFDVSLVGRAPGVHVIKSTGAPGAVASIRIRGGTSAIGTNEPLYVIDGIPVEMGDGFGNAAFQDDSRNRISPLASINPEDIESFDILKDASATAIYGSRAANGVVIVTTKKGKKGDKPNISFDFNSSADRFVNQYNVLDAGGYHNVVKTAYENAQQALPSTYIAYPDANTDWVKEATRTGITNNAYLNVNGGSANGNTLYSFSGGLTNQGGVIDHTNFKRQSLKASLETTVFDKLRFGTNINLGITENNGSGTGQYYLITKYRPDVPIFDAKGNYGASPDSVQSNPVARISQISKQKNQMLLTSFFGELEILKGLLFKTSISATISNGSNVRYTPSTDVFEIRNGRRGSRSDYASSSTNRIFDNTLTYNQRFGEHSLNLLAGASFQKIRSEYTSLSSVNFQDDEVLNNLGSAGSIQTYGSGGGISGLTSYFLRTNYNYEGKYYVTFTGRADHSTKFGPNNRWGYFPSGALAWRISRENFMRGIKDIDDLKLRVSYGKTGSANFSDFQYATFFGSGSFYFGNNGVIANTVPNPDIKWETTYQLDVAADYNLFNNKLRGSIGYFQKTTKGMILNRQIIRETGGTTQYANMGDFLNKGWELQVGSNLVNNRDFSIFVDVNITSYKSRVLKLNDGSYLSLKEGEPIGYFSGYKVNGIFQSQDEIDGLNAKSPGGVYQSLNTRPGDFHFVDVNGDGTVNTEDIGVIGKAEPDFYGGWNNVIRYKNLEINALFNFSFGNSLYNSALRDLIFFNNNTSNYSEKILQAWTLDNVAATLPRIVVSDPNRNSRDSDYFIEDASFFKLKNLQVNYVFRSDILRRVFISNLRAYASVSNVFVITKYNGLDPEVNMAPSNNFSQGYDNSIYPLTRTFTLGITANF